jgi:hypothetical protein
MKVLKLFFALLVIFFSSIGQSKFNLEELTIDSTSKLLTYNVIEYVPQVGKELLQIANWGTIFMIIWFSNFYLNF